MGENLKPTPKPDDPEQSKRFEETARQLEADESGKLFKKSLKIVAPPKPKAIPARSSAKRASA